MELISHLYIELLELVLYSSYLIQVIIDGLQIFKYISKVFIQVHVLTSEMGSNILIGFSIILASHIDIIQLERVIVIMISLRFLSYQEYLILGGFRPTPPLVRPTPPRDVLVLFRFSSRSKFLLSHLLISNHTSARPH